MLVGVVSDTHNRVGNVRNIINLFNSHKVELVIHTGDITKAQTLAYFSELNCPLKGVYGNNDLNEPGLEDTSVKFGFEFVQKTFGFEFAQKQLRRKHWNCAIDI